jgi:hypothetical protein
LEIPRQKRVNTNILIQENVDEIKQSQDEMAGKQDEIDSNVNEIKVREELSEKNHQTVPLSNILKLINNS